jgi:hypothetical protein
MKWERDFTQLRNAWLRDRNLSFAARGLLAHLMSHENGFGITMEGLAHETWKEGREALRGLVGELEGRGYLERRKVREKGRLKGYAWHLSDPFEVPADPPLVAVDSTSPSDGLPSTVSPPTAEPTVAGPSAANPTHKKTNSRTREITYPTQPQRPAGSAVDNPQRCVRGHRLVDDRHCEYGCKPKETAA